MKAATVFLDECDYLIHLIRCAIHNLQPRELPEGLKFEYVYQWGRIHEVANLAFYSVEKLKKKPEQPLYSQWQDCRDQAIVRDINQSFAAQELREAFQSAGVRAVEVQGTKIKPLYPQPDFRTMSDIDVIIDQENIPKAKEILEALGYEYEDVYRVEVNGHRPPNINVEIHTEYFLADCEYRPVLHSPFESVDDQGQCEPDVFYLYNILHIAKHYFSGGCGIRRVLDVYYLNQKYGQSIDHARVQKELKRAKVAEFAAEFGSLANAWFDLEERAFERSEMAGYVLNSGLHGSRIHEQKNVLERNFDTTVRCAKPKYFLRRFFGTAEDLQIRYPVLKRHKILYPIFWLCRIFSALKPKEIRRIKREVKTVKNIKK